MVAAKLWVLSTRKIDRYPTAAQMDDNGRFDAFLSYASRPDRVLAQRLEAWLEKIHEVTPEDSSIRPLTICRDGSDFKLSETHEPLEGETAVQGTLRHYLSRSKHLLLLCSSGAAKSANVNDEVRIFLEHSKDFEGTAADRIILAVTEGKDPLAAPQDMFPKAVIELGLPERIWVDLRGATWLRRRTVKRYRDYEEERLNLAARLCAVSVEEISPFWYRQRGQEMRRQVGALALALAILAGMAGGLFFFWRASVESERETRDTLRMALAERHQANDLEISAGYLLDVERPELTQRWEARVQELLRAPIADRLWTHPRLRMVGDLKTAGDVMLAYSLAANWGVFPPDHPAGCEVGFTAAPLGTPLVSASRNIAFVQSEGRLFRFEPSCSNGDRDGEMLEEERDLIGLWGERPIVAETATRLVAVKPGAPDSGGPSWQLPFECTGGGTPLIESDRVVLPCQDGRVVILAEAGAVATPDVPEPCRGKAEHSSTDAAGTLHAVGGALCRFTRESGSMRVVETLDEPVSSVSTSPAGTLAAVILESGAIYRVWLEEERVELVELEDEPSWIAVDDQGLLAAASQGRLEWLSRDGRLRGSRTLPDEYVHDIMFLPDGRLAVLLDDSSIRVWEGSSLRKALSPDRQMLHLSADSNGVAALLSGDDRLGVFDPQAGTLRWLAEDRELDELTERTGWVLGACSPDRSRLCWFDGLHDDVQGILLNPEIDFVEAADVDEESRRLAWYAESKIFVADLDDGETYSADLLPPVERYDVQLRVVGDQVTVLFSDDSDEQSASSWLVRVGADRSPLVAQPAESRPLVKSLAVIDGERDSVCELRADGWTICEDAAVRFRLPDRRFKTPEGETVAEEPRPADGIRRIDDGRFVVWAGDLVCLFRAGQPETCNLMGYSGTTVEVVEATEDLLVVGTLEGTVQVYATDQVERGNPVPRAHWEIGDAVVQARIVGNRLVIANDQGLLDTPVDHSGLREELDRRMGLCIEPGRRSLELGEDSAASEQRYQECLKDQQQSSLR